MEIGNINFHPLQQLTFQYSSFNNQSLHIFRSISSSMVWRNLFPKYCSIIFRKFKFRTNAYYWSNQQLYQSVLIIRASVLYSYRNNDKISWNRYLAIQDHRIYFFFSGSCHYFKNIEARQKISKPYFSFIAIWSYVVFFQSWRSNGYNNNLFFSSCLLLHSEVYCF